jgi:hypothetical protein
MVGRSRAAERLVVTPAVKLEFMMALGHSPLMIYNMGAVASGLATVSDASEIGLGVCASTSLSDRGRDTLSILQESPFLLGGDSVALIELFAGSGGFRRGCELAGLHISVHAVVERAATATAVLHHKWPEALVVTTIDEAKSKDSRISFA